jgi:(E)-4-hydroxy-3-methylbut-2-enyl-diphosphate synthase
MKSQAPSNYTKNTFTYNRRKTRKVSVGNTSMGSDYPIRVQSMTNTNTLDTQKTVEQIIRLVNIGCEYVRLATQGVAEAENLKNIKKELQKKGCYVPLIADVHFNPQIALIAAEIVEKVRINPGNYADKKQFKQLSYTEQEYNLEIERIAERLFPLLVVCKQNGTAIRIGTNHGSLSDRIISRYGNSPLGMAKSAMEYVQICNDFGFHNLVLSMKASNTRVMVQSVRLLVSMLDEKGWHYPLHLGVTEAGNGEYGRTKSAIGIGTLLQGGIGDTIRVSLTENPENEILFAFDILQACGLRYNKAEIISCPSCGRTQYNIEKFLEIIKQKTSHLKGLKIGVMGCIVNGPGEMADVDYGFVGAGNGKITLYKGKNPVYHNLNEENAVEMLIQLIKENGDWVE